MAKAKYPEHEKLKLVSHESQAIGEFLEWLDDRGFEIGERRGKLELVPISQTTERLLAEFYSVDLKKLDAEKEQMLAELRAMQREIGTARDHRAPRRAKGAGA